MSAGNQRVCVRFSEDELARVEKHLAKRRGHHACPADYSLSDFVRQAVADKLAHAVRAAKTRKRSSVKQKVGEGVG